MTRPKLTRARYDCGCRIVGSGGIDNPLHVRKCPTHTSAPELAAENARLKASNEELLAALNRAELSTTQIRLAANIGRKSAKDKVNWYVSQLKQLGHELRTANAERKE